MRLTSLDELCNMKLSLRNDDLSSLFLGGINGSNPPISWVVGMSATAPNFPRARSDTLLVGTYGRLHA
jgi:hypothetical protein